MSQTVFDKEPLVSIIIPVYNAERYLKECLDSLFAQTMREFEIICVDDGSSDGSVEMLEAYAKKDSRLRILRQQNKTAGAARNYGMSKAKGEYLLFLDADDFFSEKLEETAYNLAKESDADVALWGANSCIMPEKTIKKASWYIREDYLPVVQPFAAADIPESILKITTPAPWSKLFKREYIERHQLRYQVLPHTNDAYFTCMALMLAERIVWTKEPLVNYRRNMSDSTQGKRELAPRAFYDALTGIREGMREKGIFETYQKAYLEFARSICDFSYRAISLKALSAKERQEIERDLGLTAAQEMKDKADVRISIAVPVYNTSAYLRTCMDSLIGQTYENIEIICVNDCSTDDSLDILREYAQRDSRVIVMDKPQNEKLMRARMSAVEAATGDYLIFMDSDDYVDADTCEILAGAIRENGTDIIQYGIKPEMAVPNEEREKWYQKAYLPFEGKLSGADILRHYFISGKITTNLFGKAYRTELLKRVYAILPDMPVYVGEDIFASFFIAMQAGSYVGLSNRQLYHYRWGLGVSNNEKMSLEKFAMYNDMSKLVREIRKYVEGRKYTHLHAEALSAVSGRMLEDVLRIFAQERLFAQDIPQAEGMMAKAWYDIAGAGDLIERRLGKTVSQIMNACCPPPVYQKLSRDRLSGKDDPLVTVIVPIFNDSEYLDDCIRSVIDQDLRQIEIICINDGSYDHSLDVLEKYYESYDCISIISQANAGLSAARNAGMELARGKYLMFLDSDDMLAENSMNALIEYAEHAELDFVLFDADSFFESQALSLVHKNYLDMYHRKGEYRGVYRGVDFLCEQKRQNEYRPSACLLFLRKEWLKKHHILFEHGILHEDNLFTFSCYLNAERAAYLGKRIYRRRIRNTSIMTGVKTINHARGLYACYLGMAAEARRHNVDETQHPEIYKLIMNVRGNALRICNELMKEDRFVPRTVFDRIMQNEIESEKARKDVKSAVQESENLQRKLKGILSSRSYRLGKKIAWLPGKIRGGARCLKEHGAKHTAGLFFEKIKSRISRSRR